MLGVISLEWVETLGLFNFRGGSAPYKGLYRETLPEIDTVFRLQVY